MLEARCLLAITSTTPIPITETEALSFTDNVMHFTANDAGPFTATIAWGDLASSPGTITPAAGGGFDVSGTHTYAEDGSYTVTVLITDAADNTTVAPTTTATIGEQLLSLSAQDFSLPENSATSVLVATASDPGSPDPGSDYTATIDWGDGSAPTAGTVTATGGGNFDITGSHVYADEGSHTVTTTFFETSQAGFGTLSVSGTGTVTEADVLNNGVITLPSGVLVEGQAIPPTTQVATFSDPGYPTNSASDFTALINWGDGTAPTAGTVVALGGGNFAVQGGHTYKEEGPNTVAVVVTDDAPGTASLTITGTVDILNAPLTGSAVALHGTEGAPLTNVDVATFVDADPLGDPDDMVATIDWGDGTVTAGTVVQDAQIPPGGGTMFHVEGSHTYTEELAATFPVTVTITDRGDGDMWPLNSPFVSTTTVASTAQIVQSPLLPVANSLVSTEGKAITAGTQLATFTDTGGADAIGDYTATLNWGDGSGVHPAGVIALGQGNFAVVSNGAFTYPDEGTFALTIAITDADTTNNPGGVPTTAETTGLVVVNDAALTPAATQPTIPALTEGTPFSGAVSAFTDANTAATAADFTAQIDWGDGSPISLGSFVVGSGGAVTVDGTHTYKQDGAYTIRVVSTDDGGSVVTTTTIAVVGDPDLTSPVARAVRAVEGQDTGLVSIASFIDPDPNAALRDWNAVVHWGDGSPDDTATLVIAGGDPATGGTIFNVLAHHTYAEEGSPTAPTVTITDVDTPSNAPTVLPLNITVVDAPLTGSAGNEIAGVEGSTTGPVVLGSFVDANQGATVADFTTAPGSVVVNWGDGSAPQTLTASDLTSIGTPNGVAWTITAAHTYAEAGTYSYSITVHDAGGSATVVAGSAIIADADLTAGAAVVSTGNTGVPLSAVGVGSFTDANPGATTSDFAGTIYWGDGSPASAATFTAGAAGVFDVSGSHTYAKPGVYTVTTHVADDDGETVTLSATFTITDLPVTGATKNFTAIEGQSTGPFVLATFEDPNTLATLSDVKAVLAVGGWGDGTPTVAGIQLTVQQIGVDPANGEPVFDVIGTHTYAEESPPGTPYALSVIVTTLGGVSTTISSPAGGGVTVHDAKLTGSAGNEITGNEGNSTGTVLLGSFRDENQGATVADFTTAPGSVVVNWGDGSAPQTLAASDLASIGTAEGVQWNITSAHTYAQTGTYAYTVTVTDDGGSATTIGGSAIVADADLAAPAQTPISTTEAALFPVPVFAPPIFSGAVATFTDSNATSTVADFKADIDWGDGTPHTPGTISQPGGPGTAFTVSGSHTYADSGVNGGSATFAIQVFVVDDDGEQLTVANTATVADNPIVLAGAINPTTESGLSTGTPNVTNSKQPDFSGTSEPFSHVSLFAALRPSGAPVLIGQVQAGSDGAWNIKSTVRLADGHYAITATAVDQFGKTTTTAPVTINSNLLVDTTGPVIAGAFFNRLNGQVDYIIKDPVNPDGSAPSGVWVNSLLDSSNYLLTKVHANKSFPGKYQVTNVTATADPTIPFAYDVAVTFNGGKIIQGGFYIFVIRDSSNGNSSVQDLAENHLDGVFYGTFPSGNGIPGSDFMAELQGFHNKIFAPQSIIGTAAAANGGVGGVSTNAVHSGVFVPALPQGASPIFSTSTSVSTGDPPAVHKKVKGQIVIKQKPGQSLLSNTNGKHSKLVVSANHPTGPKHK
jgi:PKD repeat protein